MEASVQKQLETFRSTLETLDRRRQPVCLAHAQALEVGARYISAALSQARLPPVPDVLETSQLFEEAAALICARSEEASVLRCAASLSARARALRTTEL